MCRPSHSKNTWPQPCFSECWTRRLLWSLCQYQALWKNLPDNSCKFLHRQGSLTSWRLGGKKNPNRQISPFCSQIPGALQLFCPVPGRYRTVTQCVFQFYTILIEENACACSQKYRHITTDVNVMVNNISLILHCIFKSVNEMYGMIHINEANSGSLSIANGDLWSRSCKTKVPWEHIFKAMGVVGNYCGCLSLHRFAFVVSCRMWKKSVSSWV